MKKIVLYTVDAAEEGFFRRLYCVEKDGKGVIFLDEPIEDEDACVIWEKEEIESNSLVCAPEEYTPADSGWDEAVTKAKAALDRCFHVNGKILSSCFIHDFGVSDELFNAARQLLGVETPLTEEQRLRKALDDIYGYCTDIIEATYVMEAGENPIEKIQSYAFLALSGALE